MRTNILRITLIFIIIILLSSTAYSEPGRLLKAFPSSGTSPLGVAWASINGKSQLYVMDYSKEGYQVYDTKTCKPIGEPVRTGQGPRHGIVIIGDSYYAPYFNPATGGMVITSAKLGVPYPQGIFQLSASWAFALTHDGTDFWAAGARNTRKLYRFDNTGKVLQTIDMPENLLSVAWGEGSLWVLTDTRKVIRMDRSGKRLSELTLPEIMKVGGDGQGIAWDNDTKTLWITSGNSIWNVQALTGYPSLPSINASKLTKAPIIDGKPDDRCWANQPASSPFTPLQGFGSPTNSTVLRTAYDSRNLYMLVECSLPGGKQPKARKLPLDGDPWNDESVEIMLTPVVDSSTYYQIVVNAVGSIFDRTWGRGVVDGAKWNSRATAKTTLNTKGWVLELAIPLSSFPAGTVQPGTIWRFQTLRNDFTDKLESSAFAPTVTGKYHEPAQFGTLTFGQGKVHITDWRVGEPFYDGWPVEASIENSSTKPVKVNFVSDIESALGQHSKTITSASIGAGIIGTIGVSGKIKRDGLQALHLQLQNAGNGSALSSMRTSSTEFDPLNMGSLRIISGAADKDIRSLAAVKQKAFQPALNKINLDLNTLSNSLTSGKVKLADRASAAITVTSLRNRFSKLQIAARASRVGWSNPDMVVCSAQPTDQLFPESTYSADPVREVKVSLAGRESECAQLVVLPIRSNLTDIQISSEPPVGPKGSKLSLEISRVGFVNTVKPPTDMDRIGLWPDPLLKPTPFDVPADELRCVWIRVNAPAGAPAGDYTGSVTLTPAGSQPVSVAVKAHVWGFDLPLKPYLRTAFALHLSMLNDVYGSQAYDAFMNYTAEMLRNRIAPSYNSIKAWYPDINFSYRNKPEDLQKPGLWDKAEDYMKFCNANGFSGFYDIAYLDKCYDGYPDDYIQANMRFLRSFIPDLKKKGLMDQVGIYAWDEIEVENYPKHAQIAKAIKSEFPDIPILMVQNYGSAAEILKGTVDIWVPYITTYWNSRQTYLKEQAEGRQVWWYICMYPYPGKLPCPNVYIDEPAIDLRIVHWMEYKFGVTGYLYWGVNYWEPAQKHVVNEIGKSGILDWKTTEGTIMGNGEGYFFYPGPDLKPMLSVRSENFRDGIDDYDIMMMLKQAVTNPPAGTDPKLITKAKSLLAIPDDIIKSVGVYTGENRKLQSIRNQMAETLEKIISPM